MYKKQVVTALLTVLVGPALLFAGTVSGKVSYTGASPKSKPIDMSKEPSCAKQHTAPASTETVVTGPNNTLPNVVNYISAGAPDDGRVPQQAVTYVQKGCQYIPHVLVIHTSQELRVVNNDQTQHNLHPLARINREWNRSQFP